MSPDDAKGSPDSNIQAKFPNNAGGRGHDGQANGIVLLVDNLGSPLPRLQHITYKDRDVGAFVWLWVATWRDRGLTPWNGHLGKQRHSQNNSPLPLCLFSAETANVSAQRPPISLRAWHSAWSLVSLPPEHTHHLPTGNLCRHPLPSRSRKLQFCWLGHCQECTCSSKSRGCPRLSWLKTVYPSTVSCTPALELAMSLVSMNKSSFQSSDAPITLFANMQVPTGAQMLALGLCSRAEPCFSHCTTAPTSRGSFTHTHADEAEETQVCLPVDTQCSVLASTSWMQWELILDTQSMDECI